LKKNVSLNEQICMKKLYPALLMAISAIQGFSQAQRVCGTPQLHQHLLSIDPVYAANRILLDKEVVPNSGTQNSSALVTIPVVFHVIYANAAENISDNRLFDQLNVLNADFSRTNSNASNTPAAFASLGANTNIQFCLAKRDPNGNATTGIVRTSTTVSPLQNFPNNIVAPWNTTQYLNIYVGNFSGILGISPYPGGNPLYDYICVLYSSVGGPNFPGTYTPQYHLGRTATHEIGHWLNLIHISGDDGNACSGTDQVSDTPNQAGQNFNCPSFPHISCSNGPNGDMFMNYMDYSDDGCMNIFTLGQSTRMNSAITTWRNALTTSLGCVPVSVQNNPLPQSSFQVQPNPSASGTFSISYNFETKGTFSFGIYDVLGKEIILRENLTGANGKLNYDLNLSKGVYFIELIANEGRLVKKLVVH